MIINPIISSDLYKSENVNKRHFVSCKAALPANLKLGNKNNVTNKKFTNFFKKFFRLLSEKCIKIKNADVKKLSKLSVSDFLVESQKLIAKSKKYDPETMAPVVFAPLGNKKLAMVYDATSNVIYVNTENKVKPGAMLFSALAHEYEHMAQNMQILRAKSIGAKAIDEYSEIQAQRNISNFSEMYKNVKKEELPNLKEQLADIFPFLESFVQAKDSGEEALRVWTQNVTKTEKATIKSNWLNLQKMIVEKYGEIEPNTKEAKISEEYYKGFMLDGSLVGFKKLSTKNEIEAYTSTFINFYNYLLKKIF